MKKIIRIFIAGLATVFLTLNVAAQQNPATQKDTLCIASSGHDNQVIINSKSATLLTGCSDSLEVKGEIVQKGENNSITISTGKKLQAKSHKLQAKSHKFQASSGKLKRSANSDEKNTKSLVQTATCNVQHVTSNKQPATNNQQPETRNVQHVTITQSGKNNSVKINSR